jgi:hypothetical protein
VERRSRTRQTSGINLLALVAIERLLPGGDRFDTAAGHLEHLGEVAVGVGLKLR